EAGVAGRLGARRGRDQRDDGRRPGENRGGVCAPRSPATRHLFYVNEWAGLVASARVLMALESMWARRLLGGGIALSLAGARAFRAKPVEDGAAVLVVAARRSPAVGGADQRERRARLGGEHAATATPRSLPRLLAVIVLVLRRHDRYRKGSSARVAAP